MRKYALAAFTAAIALSGAVAPIGIANADLTAQTPVEITTTIDGSQTPALNQPVSVTIYANTGGKATNVIRLTGAFTKDTCTVDPADFVPSDDITKAGFSTSNKTKNKDLLTIDKDLGTFYMGLASTASTLTSTQPQPVAKLKITPTKVGECRWEYVTSGADTVTEVKSVGDATTGQTGINILGQANPFSFTVAALTPTPAATPAPATATITPAHKAGDACTTSAGKPGAYDASGTCADAASTTPAADKKCTGKTQKGADAEGTLDASGKCIIPNSGPGTTAAAIFALLAIVGLMVFMPNSFSFNR